MKQTKFVAKNSKVDISKLNIFFQPISCIIITEGSRSTFTV